MNLERRVEGELVEEDTPEVLSLIRRTMGQQGEVNEVHGSLEWSAKGEGGERLVTLSSRSDLSRIAPGFRDFCDDALAFYVPAGESSEDRIDEGTETLGDLEPYLQVTPDPDLQATPVLEPQIVPLPEARTSPEFQATPEPGSESASG